MILVWYAIWYTTQFPLQRVVIKLTITSIVDDVCDHHKHHIWTSSVFMRRYLFTPPFLQILKMRFKGDELAQYNLWLDYLDALDAVKTTSAPDIKWPTPPGEQAS